MDKIEYFSFQVSVLPPIGAILITSVTAQFADSLLSRGYNTTDVTEKNLVKRKIESNTQITI